MHVQNHNPSIDSNIEMMDVSLQAPDQVVIHVREDAVTAVAQAMLVVQVESLNEEDVNTPGKWGQTKLMDAAYANDAVKMDALIRARANIEARDRSGDTVLMQTALCGKKDITRLLIDAGADINVLDGRGGTMLNSAIMLGENEIASLLIQARANVESHDETGYTPLMNAANEGNIEVAQLLIDARAQIETCDPKGNNALFFAMTSRHKEIIRLLEKNGANKEYVKDLCNKRFMAYVLERVKQDNLEAHDREGHTPLIAAIVCGHEKAIQVLLLTGANVETRDSKNYTALMHATLLGYSKIVHMLIKANVDIDARAERGETALMQASMVGCIEIAQMLLAAGAQIESCCENGYTPLTFALSYCHTEMFNFLKERGANTQYATEFMRRKFLAASWGIEDKSHLRNTTGNYETIFNLEGMNAAYTSLKLFDYLKEFFKLNPWIERILSKENQDKTCMIIFNRYSALPSSHCSAEILDKIQSGEPVAILSGCSEHHITTMINKKSSGEYQLTVCNRGEGQTAQSTEMYSIPLKQMTETLIEKLRDKSYLTGEAFNKMIASLKLNSIGGFNQKSQKIGNCTWANTKTLVRVLCGLHLKDDALAEKIYKEFTQFAREKVIKDYLQESWDLDMGLVQKIYKKYIHEKPGLILSEKVIKEMDVLCRSYKQTLRRFLWWRGRLRGIQLCNKAVQLSP